MLQNGIIHWCQSLCPDTLLATGIAVRAHCAAWGWRSYPTGWWRLERSHFICAILSFGMWSKWLDLPQNCWSCQPMLNSTQTQEKTEGSYSKEFLVSNPLVGGAWGNIPQLTIAPVINPHGNSLIPPGNSVAHGAPSAMFSLAESEAKLSLSGLPPDLSTQQNRIRFTH